MGLDMYLRKHPNLRGYPFSKIIEAVTIFNNADGRADIVDPVTSKTIKKLEADDVISIFGSIDPSGRRYASLNYRDELLYWRKAHNIHRWFVENIQDNHDDCGYYELNKHDLKYLFNLVKKSLKYYIGGLIDKANSFLEIKDEWDFDNLIYTYKVLKDFDYNIFKTHSVYYHSSW